MEGQMSVTRHYVTGSSQVLASEYMAIKIISLRMKKLGPRLKDLPEILQLVMAHQVLEKVTLPCLLRYLPPSSGRWLARQS